QQSSCQRNSRELLPQSCRLQDLALRATAPVQSRRIDAEDFSGARLVAAAAFDDPRDVLLFDLAQGRELVARQAEAVLAANDRWRQRREVADAELWGGSDDDEPF